MKISKLLNILSLLFLVSVIFSSCLTLSSAPSIHWSLGSYTNEWGDKTGEYFTQYDGTVKALFSNSAWTNEEASITELTFSKSEGLSFHIPIATGWSPISASDVDIIIKSGDNEEKFLGRSTGPKNGRNIFIPYSDELLKSLLRENIVIRLSARTIRYQFSFPQTFKQAHERLVNKENS
jgi:hypothetical protein